MAVKRWFFPLFLGLRSMVMRKWYEYVSRLDKDANLLFLNHGYADLDPDAKPLQLPARGEKHRYSIQLYHHVASVIDWTGLEALEIGSGRGGGAAYIKQHFKPKSIIGIDITAYDRKIVCNI